jgi:hypothetical protein
MVLKTGKIERSTAGKDLLATSSSSRMQKGKKVRPREKWKEVELILLSENHSHDCSISPFMRALSL